MNILITGGASGLGASITKELAKCQDNKIYITYSFSEEKAKALESEFTNVKGVHCNFKNEDLLNVFLTSIKDYDIDVLINNAYFGSVSPKHFHKTSIDVFENDFVENTLPTIQITQELLKLFRKKKSGKIITVLTSYLTNVPPSGLSSYVGNKAYLQKLTQVWAAENGKFNITSNTISPSFMQTQLTDDVDERIIEQMVESHPLKQLLTTEEVAKTVTFLVNASLHINGLDIVMNAGVNMK